MIATTFIMSKVFIHVDLDAFYAQVEEKRLGILHSGQPLAVRQWNGLVAVNYPARARGVARFDTVQEARRKCPEINLVHVATYAEGETEWKYRPNPIRSTHKVSLDPYRQQSAAIMATFPRFCALWERGSVDEAYLDVTAEVEQQLRELVDTCPASEAALDWGGLGNLMSSSGLSE
eukprot:RCo015113